MLIRQLGLVVICWSNLDDVCGRIADLLGGFVLGGFTVLSGDSDCVLNLTLLALLDNLGFTRLQFRINAHLDLERSVFNPIEVR